MRAVVQRVSRATVTVEGETVGEIGCGLAVLVGVGHDDTEADAVAIASKLAGLRIFPDDEGKMNLPVSEVGGSVLIVSQFTLLADVRKGRRPSFTGAAAPDHAEPLVAVVGARLEAEGIEVAGGRFGAHMLVDLVNDGPVTIVIETAGGSVI
ncbi:D-tyrosyl-tRNA(Tyr) deacylase [bacterium]|nr:D-tyrosyl-tRNA(Tyr) deacylase [bacterium]